MKQATILASLGIASGIPNGHVASICSIVGSIHSEVCTMGAVIRNNNCDRAVIATHLSNPESVQFPFNYNNPLMHKKFAHNTLIYEHTCRNENRILGVNHKETYEFTASDLAPNSELEYPLTLDNDVALGVGALGAAWETIEQLRFGEGINLKKKSIDARTMYLQLQSRIDSVELNEFLFKRNSEFISAKGSVVVVCNGICDTKNEIKAKRQIAEAAILLDGYSGGAVLRNLELSLPAYQVLESLQKIEATTTLPIKFQLALGHNVIEAQVLLTATFRVDYKDECNYIVNIADTYTQSPSNSFSEKEIEIYNKAIQRFDNEIKQFRISVAVRNCRSSFIIVNPDQKSHKLHSLSEVLKLIDLKSASASLFLPFLFFSKEASILIRTVYGLADGGSLRYIVKDNKLIVINSEKLLDIDFGFEGFNTPRENYEFKKELILSKHKITQRIAEKAKFAEISIKQIHEKRRETVEKRREERNVRSITLNGKLKEFNLNESNTLNLGELSFGDTFDSRFVEPEQHESKKPVSQQSKISELASSIPVITTLIEGKLELSLKSSNNVKLRESEEIKKTSDYSIGNLEISPLGKIVFKPSIDFTLSEKNENQSATEKIFNLYSLSSAIKPKRLVLKDHTKQLSLKTAFQRSTAFVIESNMKPIQSFALQKNEMRVISQMAIGNLAFDIVEVEDVPKVAVPPAQKLEEKKTSLRKKSDVEEPKQVPKAVSSYLENEATTVPEALPHFGLEEILEVEESKLSELDEILFNNRISSIPQADEDLLQFIENEKLVADHMDSLFVKKDEFTEPQIFKIL